MCGPADTSTPIRRDIDWKVEREGGGGTWVKKEKKQKTREEKSNLHTAAWARSEDRGVTSEEEGKAKKFSGEEK